MSHPLVVLAFVFGVVSALVTVAFLVSLVVLEVERRIRERRARRRGGMLDLVGGRQR